MTFDKPRHNNSPPPPPRRVVVLASIKVVFSAAGKEKVGGLQRENVCKNCPLH